MNIKKAPDYTIHIGKTKNLFTVLGLAEPKFYITTGGRKRTRHRFIVQCNCGTVKEVDCNNLLRNNTLSCGCHRTKILPTIHKLNKQIIDAPERKEYRNYRSGAIDRGLKFDMTYEMFLDLSFKPCTYCGLSDSKNVKNETGSKTKLMNGVDRCDSSLGYIIGNIVPCCKTCNYMKRSLTVNEFLAHINRIHDHNKN